MKTQNKLTIVAAALAAALTIGTASAQLLYDGFNYTTGNTLGSNGWTLIGSSGGAATNVVAQNLSYSGLQPSIGNAVELRPNGQDWTRSYTTQTYTSSDNASIFYSFLIRVDNLGDLNATGGNFASLANPAGTAGQAASVWLRTSGAGYQVGISKRLSDPVFDTTVRTVGSTLLIVASYNLVSGLINNDTASLWINPASLTIQPAPNLTTPVSGINDDVIEFGTVALRPQGAAGSTQIPGSLIFDEVRVGNTWGSVTPIPEPSSLALLLGAGVVGVAIRRLRNRAV
jgi:hypothetical protein